MESQPQNSEFRNNPENFHPCGPDLDQNCLTLVTFLNYPIKTILKKISRRQKCMKNYQASTYCKVNLGLNVGD